jgi:hypothetical protein
VFKRRKQNEWQEDRQAGESMGEGELDTKRTHPPKLEKSIACLSTGHSSHWPELSRDFGTLSETISCKSFSRSRQRIIIVKPRKPEITWRGNVQQIVG